MSWRSRGRPESAWRGPISHLRQEASGSGGFASEGSIKTALEALSSLQAEAQDRELAEDLSFLAQQLLGPASGSRPKWSPNHASFCQLLCTLSASRGLKLHAPAANLVLGALRQWADGSPVSAGREGTANPGSRASSSTSSRWLNVAASSDAHSGTPPAPSTALLAAAAAGTTPTTGTAATNGSAGSGASGAGGGGSGGLAGSQAECLAALAALLPEHLGLLSEAERAAQLAALQSLLAPAGPGGQEGGSRARPSDQLEAQTLALGALAACFARPPGAITPSPSASSTLNPDEACAAAAALCSLLHAAACRARPAEDSAHSRMYAALLRALGAAVAAPETRPAWRPRVGTLVEGLQRLLTYGVAHQQQYQPQQQPQPQPQQPSAGSRADSALETPPQSPRGDGGAGGAGGGGAWGGGGGGGGGRYRPPHLRRGAQPGGDGAASDSDMSDSEHGGAPHSSAGSSSGGAVAAPDRFRSSRVRQGALGAVQALARADPRALQPHWGSLLPLQAPLQSRPLAPHLLTVLLYDPLAKIRALAAATLTTLLDGPATRALLAVAEAPAPPPSSSTPSSRAAPPAVPLRGFLTLSRSLGAQLLAAHAGLLAAVGREGGGEGREGGGGGGGVLPGVLRALVALLAAAPHERLPPGLLPEAVQVLRARWAALSSPSSPSCLPSADLPPIRAAYLACLAECLATRAPVAGLAAWLRGAEGTAAAADLVRQQLLPLAADAAAPAVLRIEALAALKGMAAHYVFALPAGAWPDLRAAAEVGLSALPAPRSSPPGRTSAPVSRTSSSSSLSAALAPPPSPRAAPAPGRRGPSQQPPHAGPPADGSSMVVGSANTSPEDKAAQLAVKLLSEYLGSLARQCGICSAADVSAAEADGPMGSGSVAAMPPPSHGVLKLAAAPPRPQQQGQGQVEQQPGKGEEETGEEGVARLARLWEEAVGVLVPSATSHASYMVRAAALACLAELPEPVFSALPPALQHSLLGLLSAAAGTDAVAAVRAAGCKALGAAAAFPAVLATPALSAGAVRPLQACLRDGVVSVRIAAGWAVANLCDAHRRRLAREAAEEAEARDPRVGAEQRATSHARASTSSALPATPRGRQSANSEQPSLQRQQLPALEAHHYAQLAALAAAAIAAAQDADKVRANGVRAIGNLLAALTPDMAPGLAAAAAAAPGGAHRAAAQAGRDSGSSSGLAGPGGNSAAGGGGRECLVLADWLDAALACLQSCLTTGSMKVQWNACVAVTGLLRNGPLLAAPRVAARSGPLLLLLVMLVRDSANFKIRTHAAAALAALPSREAAGEVLADALLVVAGALEAQEPGGGGGGGTAGMGGGGGAGGPGAAPTGPGLGRSGSMREGALAAPPSAGGCGGGGRGGEGDGDGEGGEGRFPNFRYAAGLAAQLRSTLLHLLALAQARDAARVREALARRAEFVHGVLRQEAAEAAQPLLAAAAAGGTTGGRGAWAAGSGGSGSGPGSPSGRGGGAVELPADPFGLSGSGRGAAPRAAGAAGGLAKLLEALSLQAGAGSAPSAAHPSAGAPDSGRRSGGSRGPGPASPASPTSPTSPRPGLAAQLLRACSSSNGNNGAGGDTGASGGGDGDDQQLRVAARRLGALEGALAGFAALLGQLGPAAGGAGGAGGAGEALQRDVVRALAALRGG